MAWLAGIRADGAPRQAFPDAVKDIQWHRRRVKAQPSSTYRCGGSAGWARYHARAALLPVELRPVNQSASTNGLSLLHLQRAALHDVLFLEAGGK